MIRVRNNVVSSMSRDTDDEDETEDDQPETFKPQWQVGDQVRLKSGGNPMTAFEVVPEFVGVAYFDFKAGLVVRDQFDARMLITFPEKVFI